MTIKSPTYNDDGTFFLPSAQAIREQERETALAAMETHLGECLPQLREATVGLAHGERAVRIDMPEAVPAHMQDAFARLLGSKLPREYELATGENFGEVLYYLTLARPKPTPAQRPVAAPPPKPTWLQANLPTIARWMGRA